MDRLWSPWRYRYVSRATPQDGCVFCIKAAEEQDEENLVLYRGRFCYVLLNLYPYTNGHLMICPYEHIAMLDELNEEAASELMALTQRSVRAIRATYKPHGINAGLNLGECAGAGVVGHLHMHVLPRWAGDANFMTTIGETRVIPEDLHDSWQRLKAVF